MAKSKEGGKNSANDQEVNVKVYGADRDLILRVAGACGHKKVADLFASDVVREFLTHLMVEAAMGVKEKQEARKKS
jgi:hypothetical protein